MSAKLFVGNLSTDTTRDDLHALFSEIGPVESCDLITDRKSGLSRGYAFVLMDSKEAALASKESLDGRELKGKTLKVR